MKKFLVALLLCLCLGVGAVAVGCGDNPLQPGITNPSPNETPTNPNTPENNNSPEVETPDENKGEETPTPENPGTEVDDGNGESGDDQTDSGDDETEDGEQEVDPNPSEPEVKFEQELQDEVIEFIKTILEESGVDLDEIQIQTICDDTSFTMFVPLTDEDIETYYSDIEEMTCGLILDEYQGTLAVEFSQSENGIMILVYLEGTR